MYKSIKYFNLIHEIVRSKGLISQHIESFNYFLSTDVRKIIFINSRNKFGLDDNFSLKFANLRIGPVSEYMDWMEIPITPHQCRVTDTSYGATIFVDLSYKLENKIYTFFNFNFCKFPIMLHSRNCVLFNKNEKQLITLNECPLDPGGYFIIKGTEKVVLVQEQIFMNRISIEQDQQGFVMAVVNSFSTNRRTKNVVILKSKKLYFRHKIFVEDIPVFILLKSFGFEKNSDILDLIGHQYEDVLDWSLFEARVAGITSHMQAIYYVTQRFNAKFFTKTTKGEDWKLSFDNKAIDICYEAFSAHILVHLSSDGIAPTDLKEKGIFISLMVRKIFLRINQPTITDNKDYYGNKRLDLGGQIISILFEDLFYKTIKEAHKFYKQNYEKFKKNINLDLISFVRTDIINNGLEYSFSTGNWIVKKFKIEKNGVTQTLSRLSFIATLSIVTKITSQNEKIRKIRGPRSLHSSQWGMICPTDTPEGESCGLVKDLAVLAHISTRNRNKLILKICENLGLETPIFSNSRLTNSCTKLCKIFLNGRYLGTHNNPSNFIFSFRSFRRSGMINYYVSIFWDTFSDEINIATDEGRICRPFLVIDFGFIKMRQFQKILLKNGLNFCKDFVRQGILEYLDVNEQNNAIIAYDVAKIDIKTTHLEISPEVVLGICGSLIPFLNHNQSPRNTYQCAMGKQAIGSISFNQNQRCDTILSLLVYPQKPLVKTKIIYFSGNNRLNSGLNACICILSFSGYDIEDSIILNRSSIQRGFFRSVMLRKHKVLLKNLITENKSMPCKNVAARTKSKKEADREKNKADSVKATQNAVETFANIEKQLMLRLSLKELTGESVEKIIFSSNFSELFFVKLMLRQIRSPEVGDKFSSRHGQKGVCGAICFQKDLPFSNDGISPDLIMNPHGFPSRMTIGKIIELLGAKIGSIKGKFCEGTPFNIFNTDTIKKKLNSLGYSSKGKDVFCSGITGNPLTMEVFSGPVFYQKLKHMVKDKIHARSKGPRSNITRQPIEGRSKGGGLRFGEMERDCLISYGAAETIIERLLISSDLFIANFDIQTGFFTEKKRSSTTVTVKLPYACKLLFEELQSMNILPRLTFGVNFKEEKSID